MRVLLFLLIQLLRTSGCSSPVTLQWRRPPTRRLLALFAFPQTVTLQGTIESRKVSLLLKQPAPSTQQAGRQATDRPSTVLSMTLGFQEPAAALTLIRPGV